MERKRIILSSFVILSSLVFIVKLYSIQIADSKYKLSAENNAHRNVTQYPARGIIFDRDGNMVVFNEHVYDLKVVPKRLREFDTLKLCELIGVTKNELITTLKSEKQSPYKPVTVAKQIPFDKYAVLQEYLYRFPDFYIEKRTVRKYLESIAAHLLGYVGEVSESDIEQEHYYKMGDFIGKSGIEKNYEEDLRGTKGVKILLVDVHNSVKGSYNDGKVDTSAVAGRNFTSSLDSELQEYGEKLMLNKIGGVVALEPESGEILCLVSSPTYDPNLFVGQKLAKNYGNVASRNHKPLYNRALKSPQPPGSTFKTVAALIGLQEEVLKPNTVIVVNGYSTGTHFVKDHISGAVNLEASIQHSSNAYYCHVLKRTLNDKKFGSISKAYANWKEHLHSFGLGVKMGTDLAYESKGLIYPASYFDKYYGKGRWNHNTIISLAIGQGELGFTPLQLANMTATIANRGYYITPHIVKKIDGKEIDNKYIFKNYTKVKKEHFEPVINGMEKVVTAGTARIAFVNNISICGKTGTAQNPHGEDHSIFIAFAPKDKPKIAIAVYIENGGYGATWAAPIASLMIEKYLNDSTSRPFLEKRMVEGIIVNE